MTDEKHSIDMLHGPLAGKLVRFALPIAAASILQQLFNSVDLAVVGRFDSSTAMAAVGSNAALINLMVSLFGGLSLGGTVTVASLIGLGRKDKINRAVHTSVTLAFISGLIVLAIGEFLAPTLLRLMNTPDSVLNLAVVYLRIFFVSVPLFLVYDFGSSILRAKGDSRRPLYALIASGLVNVVLNLFFVISLGMGVAGVAIATVISNGVSCLMVIAFLHSEEETFRLSFRKLGINKDDLRRIVMIGLPAGLQGMVFSLSNVVIQAGINSFGANAIAGNSAGQNFEFMTYFIINAFGQAATTFTSQNYSAGDTERCRKIYKLALLIGMLSCFTLSAVFTLGRHWFILFFNDDPEVIHYAMYRICIICLFELLTGTYEIPGGCLRGMHRSMLPAVITVLGSCVFRLIWVATVFQMHHTIIMLMIVYPISWVITGTAMNIAYFRIRKKAFAHAGEDF
jgi:putative MATE family efflux protein